MDLDAPEPATPRHGPLDELTWLLGQSRWFTLPIGPTKAIHINPWPDGSVDTITVYTGDTWHFERLNPSGELVWRRKGDLADCLREYRAIPAPMAPGAPSEVLRDSPHTVDRDM